MSETSYGPEISPKFHSSWSGFAWAFIIYSKIDSSSIKSRSNRQNDKSPESPKPKISKLETEWPRIELKCPRKEAFWHTLQRYVHVLVPVLVLSFVLCTWDSEVRYKKVQIWHKSSKNSLISILTITFFNRIPDLSELFLFDKKIVQNFHGKIVANFKENIRFRGKIHIENPMFYFWPKNALFLPKNWWKNLYFCTSDTSFSSKIMCLYFCA